MSRPIGIILAAGRGSRMAELTKDKPKGLVQFKGKELISYSIDNILANGIQEINIVIGYLGQKIKQFVRDNYKGKNINFIRNDDWSTTNSGGSLRLALKSTDVSNGFILSESDLYWEPTDIRFSETSAFVGQLANRKGATTTKEGFLQHSNDKGSLYKTINIYSFNRKDASKAKELLTSEYDNEYYESAWYGLIKFKNLYLNNYQWGEFDETQEMIQWDTTPFPFESVKLVESNDDSAYESIFYKPHRSIIKKVIEDKTWYLAKVNINSLIPTEKTSRLIIEGMEESIIESNSLTKPLMVYSNSDIYYDEEKRDVLITSKELFVMDGHHRLQSFKEKGFIYIYVAITNQKLDTKSINRIVGDEYVSEFMEILSKTDGIESYKQTNDLFVKKEISLNRNYNIIDYTTSEESILMPEVGFDEFFEYVKEKGPAPIKTIFFHPKPKDFGFAWRYDEKK